MTDGIGAPSELADRDGHVVWRADPTIWGEPAAIGPSEAECPWGYPGQYHDAESALAYNRYRYYDPASGRYLSSDPLGLGAGLDPHGYVANPLVEIDPLGLAACPGRIAIGEGQGRVDDWARHHDAITVRSDPDFWVADQGIRGGGRPQFSEAEKLIARRNFGDALAGWNLRWLERRVSDGYQVHDLGRLTGAFERPPGFYPQNGLIDFYGLEQARLATLPLKPGQHIRYPDGTSVDMP